MYRLKSGFHKAFSQYLITEFSYLCLVLYRWVAYD